MKIPMKSPAPTSGPLPYLETFSTAAECSCFTRAAAQLGLTQAAVSQRMRALEQALGVALFRRQGGRVCLTPAGQRLYPYAQRIQALHQEARREVAGQKTPVTGELLLAASSIPGEHLLPAILADFRRRYPHVQVRATVADSAAVLHQVEHGHSHLGLVGRKSESPHLEFRPFATDAMVLIVPPGHRWARLDKVSLKQLGREPLILREAGSGSRGCLEQALAQAGQSLAAFSVALELGSNEAIKEAVLRGLGVAVLSTHAVHKELQAGQLHALRVRELCLEREMFVVWDRRRVLPIPARLFFNFLEGSPAAEPAP
jgi:DNA-binding transcriptional LysR family regulator